MFLRKSLLGTLGIVLAGGIVVVAQEPQPQTPAAQDDAFRQERIERRHERLGRREGMRHEDGRGWRGLGIGRLARELNLTEEQQQQTRAIVQRRLESLGTQREELFKLHEKRVAGTLAAEDGARARNLRQQIRLEMEGFETEMSGLLTAEQKTKLEQLRKDHREKREQRMRERKGRLNQE